MDFYFFFITQMLKKTIDLSYKDPLTLKYIYQVFLLS